GIDFCELYSNTRKQEYLNRALNTWKFVISGWDDKLDGGIYWCEQKKISKNTCSNAPASVLALKLFKATGDSSFFKYGKRIYDWTQTNLRDPEDHLYFDNKDLSGKTDKRKYTYNSGQMLQASVMLYKLTGEKDYLNEAGIIANSVINHFTEDYLYKGNTIKLFKNTGNWFNYILLRGYMELYSVDKNPIYLNIFRDNMDQVWDYARNKEGLFMKDWKGQKENQYNELLDQAGLMAIFAALASV
ncbi:MAG: glycoside hydrolase family 76 protein, partial [Chloroflexota bacterium]